MFTFQSFATTYQQALLRQVVSFWLNHGRDERCGGYFDLLSATGEPIDGDKFVTLQAQQTWAFAWLYNTFDGQPAWLAHARHGATFLRQYAHSAQYGCYEQLDRRGRPVGPSTNLIPDSHVIIAYAQLHRATGDEEWAELARQTFMNLLDHRSSLRAKQQQTLGDFRQLRHLIEPLSFLEAVVAMRPLLDEEPWQTALDSVMHELFNEFLDRRADTLREYILPEGAFSNTPEGRRLNVGLIFQASSQLLDFSAERSDRKLTTQVVAWCLRLCERAWNDITGGLDQYVDVKNQPGVFPDWQQKWAWVHVEGIRALLKGYSYTHHPDCRNWFKRIHDYTFGHFPDSLNTGWHVAIDGFKQPLLRAKAIPAVGCFSLIRCLAETAQLLTTCDQLPAKKQFLRTI